MTLIEKKNVVKTKVNIQMCVETWEAGKKVKRGPQNQKNWGEVFVSFSGLKTYIV